MFDTLQIMTDGLTTLTTSIAPTFIKRVKKRGQGELEETVSYGIADDRIIMVAERFPEETLFVPISLASITDDRTKRPIDIWFRDKTLGDLKKFLNYLANVASKFKQSTMIGLKVLQGFKSEATILMGMFTIALPFTLKDRLREQPLSKNQVKAIARDKRRQEMKAKREAFTVRKEAWPPKTPTVVLDSTFAIATGGRGVVVLNDNFSDKGTRPRSHAPSSEFAKKTPLVLMIKGSPCHEEPAEFSIEAGESIRRWWR